jgi:predicted RNase H-like HicB family nuclease
VTDFRAEAEKYLILIEGGPPTNYSACSPDVLGCVATGDTIDEVKREMREALALHLRGMAEDRLPLPEPSGPGAYVAA